MTTRLVIDCDTGTDDAFALMLAALHPELELLAVTTVNGNVAVANVTENTLRVLDHIGAVVPVHAGAARPFLRPDLPVPRHILNGEDPEFQPQHLDLPPSTTPAQRTSAVRALVETFMDPANEDVVLVATGPLTNVALALASEPGLAARISKLVIMGGAHVGGNVTPAAEFNFWADPEAAQSVFTSGIREIVVVPLDATHSAPLTIADCDAFDALDTAAGRAAAQLLRHRIEKDSSDDSAPVHDPLCVAYLLRPDVALTSGEHHVAVETGDGLTIGEMVVDTRPWATEPANARVVFTASTDIFREVLLEAFAIDLRSRVDEEEMSASRGG